MSDGAGAGERVAAIDCGTNSIRLLVRDLPGADLHREMRVVRLGQGVDRTGELHPDAVERTRLRPRTTWHWRIARSRGGIASSTRPCIA